MYCEPNSKKQTVLNTLLDLKLVNFYGDNKLRPNNNPLLGLINVLNLFSITTRMASISLSNRRVVRVGKLTKY